MIIIIKRSLDYIVYKDPNHLIDPPDNVYEEFVSNPVVGAMLCCSNSGSFIHDGVLYLYTNEDEYAAYNPITKQFAMGNTLLSDDTVNFDTRADGGSFHGDVTYNGSKYVLLNTSGGIGALVRLKGTWDMSVDHESTRELDVIFRDIIGTSINNANKTLGYAATLVIYNQKLVIASARGIYQVNPDTGTLTHLFDPPAYCEDDISTSYAVCNNRMYYIDNTHSLWVYDDKRWNKLCSFNMQDESRYQYELTVINDTLFIVFNNKVYYFDGITFVPYDITTDEKNTPIRRLIHDPDNNVTYVVQQTSDTPWEYKTNIVALSTIKEEEITMPTNVRKNATFTTMIDNVVTDLMLKTTAAQVEVSDDMSLADKLTELTTAISNKAGSEHTHLTSDVTGLDDALTARPTKAAMDTAISTAISELINGAPETYDTLKEIADYIEAHEEVATALNEAIGKKADAATVETLQTLVNSIKTTVDGLGALASKDKVSTADLDESLAAEVGKIANKAEASDVTDLQSKAHEHTNKAVLDRLSVHDPSQDFTEENPDYNYLGISAAEYGKLLNTNSDGFPAIVSTLRDGDIPIFSYSTPHGERTSEALVPASAFLAEIMCQESKMNGLTNDLKDLFDAQSKTYYSATQPEGLKNGDTWFKLDE